MNHDIDRTQTRWRLPGQRCRPLRRTRSQTSTQTAKGRLAIDPSRSTYIDTLTHTCPHQPGQPEVGGTETGIETNQQETKATRRALDGTNRHDRFTLLARWASLSPAPRGMRV